VHNTIYPEFNKNSLKVVWQRELRAKKSTGPL